MGRIISSSRSYSSRMLPTISSRMSSMVTMPDIWPYSSTTITMCTFRDCMSLNRASTLRLSGTKLASIIRPGISRMGVSS